MDAKLAAAIKLRPLELVSFARFLKLYTNRPQATKHVIELKRVYIVMQAVNRFIEYSKEPFSDMFIKVCTGKHDID